MQIVVAVWGSRVRVLVLYAHPSFQPWIGSREQVPDSWSPRGAALENRPPTRDRGCPAPGGPQPPTPPLFLSEPEFSPQAISQIPFSGIRTPTAPPTPTRADPRHPSPNVRSRARDVPERQSFSPSPFSEPERSSSPSGLPSPNLFPIPPCRVRGESEQPTPSLSPRAQNRAVFPSAKPVPEPLDQLVPWLHVTMVSWYHGGTRKPGNNHIVIPW